MLIEYADDRPKECKSCYFWIPGKKRCKLGQCYYSRDKNGDSSPFLQCDGCPYGKDRPCIGWCTQMILKRKDK